MCLTIFLTVNHKYINITDGYKITLHDLSVENEIIVSHFLKDVCEKLANTNLKRIKLVVVFNCTSIYELKTYRFVIDIVHIIWARFPVTKLVFVSAIFPSRYSKCLLENVYTKEIVLNSVIDFNELCSIIKKDSRNDSFSQCWN